MTFLFILTAAIALAGCRATSPTASSDSDLEARRAQASSKQKLRIFNQRDYREIQSTVMMNASNKQKVSRDLCYGPAIAAWVDLVRRNAAKANEREPAEFRIKDMTHLANLETVNIVDSNDMNYIVHAGGVGECTASNANGPVSTGDVLTD